MREIMKAGLPQQMRTMEKIMKTLIKACLLSAMLTLPAYAQTDTAPKADAAPKAATGMMMNCPMMGDMGGMQKDMGGMMSDMQAMMKDTKDPAMKERMAKMHTQMTAMMASMQKMGMGGMMGNGMMGGQQPANAAPAKPETAPVSPDDHAAHHPAQ
jgi:hypothetical protein